MRASGCVHLCVCLRLRASVLSQDKRQTRCICLLFLMCVRSSVQVTRGKLNDILTACFVRVSVCLCICVCVFFSFVSAFVCVFVSLRVCVSVCVCVQGNRENEMPCVQLAF